MTAEPNLIEVDDTTFDQEVLSSEVPVLVDFGAAWCGPCRAMKPIVERIAAENAGRLKVVMVDADAAPRTMQRYGVRGVPIGARLPRRPADCESPRNGEPAAARGNDPRRLIFDLRNGRAFRRVRVGRDILCP